MECTAEWVARAAPTLAEMRAMSFTEKVNFLDGVMNRIEEINKENLENN